VALDEARPFVVGSRESQLALRQADWLVNRVREAGSNSEFEIRKIRTQGDRAVDVPLDRIEGKGFFVKEIESALLRGEIDLAVHSLKDLPTELPEGLVIAAVSPRIDPGDVLVSRLGLGLDALPPGAKVGTSSLRRAAQLRHHRPDLQVVDLRGNVDTRLRKAATEAYDAIVIAAAGLLRLGLESQVTEHLPLDVCLPAIGQGVLAVEIRASDARARDLLQPIDDAETRMAILAERAFLCRLGGGCLVPVGAYAERRGANLTIAGMVACGDGSAVIRGERSGPADEPERLGEELATELLGRGAGELLREQRELEAKSNSPVDPWRPV
jgi:hydroxymethylbilane synthase